MELERGVKRWVVDISKWDPTPHHFSMIMSVLPHHEHSSITRYVKLEDKKQALVSRLLQYGVVHQVLGIPIDEIIIRRTPEGKPFLVCDEVKPDFPNFNFNVSHHGDYVAIASEPLCLVGLDIVTHTVPVNETAKKFIQSFSSYFSPLEWYNISNAGSSDEMLRIFFRYWCLKEAFVKAIGFGVGYKLDDVEFHHSNWGDIVVKVAGNVLKDWKFWLLELGHLHSVVFSSNLSLFKIMFNFIALNESRFLSLQRRCRLLEVTRSLPSLVTRELNRTEFSDEEYNAGLHLPNAHFTFLSVNEVVQLWYRVDRISNELMKSCVSDESEIDKPVLRSRESQISNGT